MKYIFADEDLKSTLRSFISEKKFRVSSEYSLWEVEISHDLDENMYQSRRIFKNEPTQVEFYGFSNIIMLNGVFYNGKTPNLTHVNISNVISKYD